MKEQFEKKLKEIFWNIFPQGQMLRKKDLANYGLSYNKLFHSGIILSELNKKFESEYWDTNPKLCVHCQKSFKMKAGDSFGDYRIRKFCNQSCAASFNNVQTPKRIAKPKTVTYKIFDSSLTYKKCHWCLKQCKGAYCSNVCSNAARFCDGFLNWYYKKTDKHYNKSIREYLILMYGQQCDNYRLGKKCYCNPDNFDKLVLEVDHIDGHHENNAPSNVRLLCPSCHMMTDTFTGKNKGNGREYRRIRYEEGKSF